MRYKLTIEYDGSYFHGFQRQKNLISVQSKLEDALTEILKEETLIRAAGRTDALVHAKGQVVDFKTSRNVPPKNLKKILNKKLYPGIYIKDVEIVDERFHSRIYAIKKEYHYFVSINEYSVFNARYMYQFHNRIDIDKIKEAMEYIKGTHDFTSFSKNHTSPNMVRTIESFDLIEKDGILEFIIVGNGFLHNMVRIIIALILKVGEGKFEPLYIKKALDAKSRKACPYVAPAEGLYLWKVYYEEN